MNVRGLYHTAIVCVCLLHLTAVWTAAAESPFGLPPPHDELRPGAILLHGGGYSFSDEIRREFVRLAGGRDARIVLMPSESYQIGKDSDGNPLKQRESAAAYEHRMAGEYDRWTALKTEGRIADLQFLYRCDEDVGDARLLSRLETATGVWIPAHDQEWRPQEFAAGYPAHTSRFQLLLRDVVSRGGVVGGLSGGMACLPETIIAGNTPIEDGWARADLRFGLALFRGVIVDQNFDAHAGRLERLTDLLRNGPRLDRLAETPGVERRTIGLGVEQQTVAILQGDTVRVLGEGRTHIFLKSNGDRTVTWRTLSAGDDPLVVQPASANAARKMAPVERESLKSFNPLGVPEPNDPKRIGTIVLHGGGDTDEIIDLYPQLIGIPAPRIVHCPAARDSCRPTGDKIDTKLAAHLEETFAEWRKLQTDGRIDSLTFVTTNQLGSANSTEFVAPIREAQGVWFCGGDQAPLARLFVDPLRPTLFQEAVLDVLRRGGVVGGSSAGLAIMADVMIEGGESIDGGPAEADLSRGLGVLKSALAEQHFDARSGRIERLTGLLRNRKRLANFSPTSRPKSMVGLAVEEDTALLVQGHRLQVIGKKLAHVFLQGADSKTVTWHALKPGDVAQLRPDRETIALELDDWEFRD